MGIEITVTLVDTPPTVSSLKLGNVNLTGSGVVSPSTIFKKLDVPILGLKNGELR